jgi:predicted transport protein
MDYKEEIQEQPVEVDAKQEIAVANEDTEDDREVAKRIPFAEKMLAIDAKTQSYYNTLNNTFRSLRKINPRISMKGVSYRLGKELVAKITIRGKTMRLHLALDVNAFAQNVYFQKDLSDVKAYAEVPLMVKVKSDRGLKNALKLVDALIQEKGIEKKTRFVEIDSLEDLK